MFKFPNFLNCILVFMFSSLLLPGCGKVQKQIGEAPELSLKNYAGETFTLTPKDGKVTLLVFWATWCGPCLREIPSLVELHEKLKGQNFQVVAINMDDSIGSLVLPIIKNFGITYPTLIGKEQVTKDYGGIQYLPTSFLIGRDGLLKEKMQGFVTPGELFAKIKVLL